MKRNISQYFDELILPVYGIPRNAYPHEKLEHKHLNIESKNCMGKLVGLYSLNEDILNIKLDIFCDKFHHKAGDVLFPFIKLT